MLNKVKATHNREIAIRPIPLHSTNRFPSSSSSALTIILSILKNITMATIDVNEEKMPHSPNAVGPYRRDNIGVTIIGNTYIIILLTDNLAVFTNNDWPRSLSKYLFKTYIS